MLAAVADVVFIYLQTREHPLNSPRNPVEQNRKEHFCQIAESQRQEIGESDFKKLRCLRVF